MTTGDMDDVNDRLELIIFRLYALMTQAADLDGRDRHESAAAMRNEVLNLVQSLISFSRASQDLQLEVTEDVISYVESGRNPDIYNREFVEALQGLNRGLAGRSDAYAQFRDALALEMKTVMPDIAPHVDKAVENTGGLTSN